MADQSGSYSEDIGEASFGNGSYKPDGDGEEALSEAISDGIEEESNKSDYSDEFDASMDKQPKVGIGSPSGKAIVHDNDALEGSYNPDADGTFEDESINSDSNDHGKGKKLASKATAPKVAAAAPAKVLSEAKVGIRAPLKKEISEHSEEEEEDESYDESFAEEDVFEGSYAPSEGDKSGTKGVSKLEESNDFDASMTADKVDESNDFDNSLSIQADPPKGSAKNKAPSEHSDNAFDNSMDNSNDFDKSLTEEQISPPNPKSPPSSSGSKVDGRRGAAKTSARAQSDLNDVPEEEEYREDVRKGGRSRSSAREEEEHRRRAEELEEQRLREEEEEEEERARARRISLAKKKREEEDDDDFLDALNDVEAEFAEPEEETEEERQERVMREEKEKEEEIARKMQAALEKMGLQAPAETKKEEEPVGGGRRGRRRASEEDTKQKVGGELFSELGSFFGTGPSAFDKAAEEEAKRKEAEEAEEARRKKEQEEAEEEARLREEELAKKQEMERNRREEEEERARQEKEERLREEEEERLREEEERLQKEEEEERVRKEEEELQRKADEEEMQRKAEEEEEMKRAEEEETRRRADEEEEMKRRAEEEEEMRMRAEEEEEMKRRAPEREDIERKAAEDEEVMTKAAEEEERQRRAKEEDLEREAEEEEEARRRREEKEEQVRRKDAENATRRQQEEDQAQEEERMRGRAEEVQKRIMEEGEAATAQRSHEFHEALQVNEEDEAEAEHSNEEDENNSASDKESRTEDEAFELQHEAVAGAASEGERQRRRPERKEDNFQEKLHGKNSTREERNLPETKQINPQQKSIAKSISSEQEGSRSSHEERAEQRRQNNDDLQRLKDAEEAKRNAVEEELQKYREAELQRHRDAEEARCKQEEEERLREEERVRKEEEDSLRKKAAEDELKRKAEEQEMERRAQEEEAKRKAHEEEARRRAEEVERLRQELEEERSMRAQEDERRAREQAEAEDAKRRHEEQERQAEQERIRKAEEQEREKKLAEAEAEELRRKEAEESRRRGEEEERLQEVERLRQVLEEQMQKKTEEDEVRRRADEQEVRRKAEEIERMRKELEEERQTRLEEDGRRRREQEEEESRRKLAEEAKRRQEEEERKQDAERRLREEELQKVREVEEAKRKVVEDELQVFRDAEEMRRKQEQEKEQEERRKREEAERDADVRKMVLDCLAKQGVDMSKQVDDDLRQAQVAANIARERESDGNRMSGAVVNPRQMFESADFHSARAEREILETQLAERVRLEAENERRLQESIERRAREDLLRQGSAEQRLRELEAEVKLREVQVELRSLREREASWNQEKERLAAEEVTRREVEREADRQRGIQREAERHRRVQEEQARSRAELDERRRRLEEEEWEQVAGDAERRRQIEEDERKWSKDDQRQREVAHDETRRRAEADFVQRKQHEEMRKRLEEDERVHRESADWCLRETVGSVAGPASNKLRHDVKADWGNWATTIHSRPGADWNGGCTWHGSSRGWQQADLCEEASHTNCWQALDPDRSWNWRDHHAKQWRWSDTDGCQWDHNGHEKEDSGWWRPPSCEASPGRRSGETWVADTWAVERPTSYGGSRNGGREEQDARPAWRRNATISPLRRRSGLDVEPWDGDTTEGACAILTAAVPHQHQQQHQQQQQQQQQLLGSVDGFGVLDSVGFSRFGLDCNAPAVVPVVRQERPHRTLPSFHDVADCPRPLVAECSRQLEFGEASVDTVRPSALGDHLMERSRTSAPDLDRGAHPRPPYAPRGGTAGPLPPGRNGRGAPDSLGGFGGPGSLERFGADRRTAPMSQPPFAGDHFCAIGSPSPMATLSRSEHGHIPPALVESTPGLSPPASVAGSTPVLSVAGQERQPLPDTTTLEGAVAQIPRLPGVETMPEPPVAVSGVPPTELEQRFSDADGMFAAEQRRSTEVESQHNLLMDLADGNPDIGGSLVKAVGEVLHELLELKYNSGLDVADFAAKIERNCNCYAAMSVPRLLDEVSSRKGLMFLDHRGKRLQQLRLNWKELQTFEDMQRSVRLMPGTASAVAFVTTGGSAVDVLAVFRMAYSDASLAVGRSCGLPGRPLRHFGEEAFTGAISLDPSIVTTCASDASASQRRSLAAAPPHAAEYAGLESLVHGGRGAPAGVARAPPEIFAVVHAPGPSATTMKQAAAVLQQPDMEPEAVQEVLQKIAGWLKREPEAALARRAIESAQVQKAVTAVLRRHSGHKEVRSCACRVLGYASRHHVENAAAFVESGAVQEVCQVLLRHVGDKELQRHALYALGCLAHYGGGAEQVVQAGAVATTLRSLTLHRNSPSIQINGCELLRCLAELGGAPLDDLGQAAQNAKHAFKHDMSVHRSADALLGLVVPRMAGSIGSLMDSKPLDIDVQSSGVRALGQLAQHGGVAWRGVAAAAVSRVIRAMKRNKGNTSVQAVGLWALGRLAERVEAPVAGMYDAAECAKQAHPESALVQRHADQLRAYLLQK